MSRVDSHARVDQGRAGLSLKGSVVASDAFFPFRDGLDEVVEPAADRVIQPGGSVKDAEVIAAANDAASPWSSPACATSVTDGPVGDLAHRTPGLHRGGAASMRRRASGAAGATQAPSIDRQRAGQDRNLGTCDLGVRAAEVPARLRPLRVRQPGRPQGRRAAAAQPGSALQLRQVQPVHRQGRGAGRHRDLHDGGAGTFVAGRAAGDVRPARRGDAGRAGPVGDLVPHPPQGALHQWRRGHAAGRGAQLRAAQRPAGITGLPQRVRTGIARVVAVDGRTVRFELKEHKVDALFVAGSMPVFSHKWGGGKKFDADRRRATDRQRAVRDRQVRDAAHASNSAATRTTGRATWACGAATSTSIGSSTACTRTAPSGARRSRPASSTSCKEYGARSWVRQHQGPKWRDGRILKRPSRPPPARACRPPTSTCGAPKFQDIRVREAIVLGLGLRNHQPVPHLRARQQPVQQLRVRRPGPAVAGRAGVAGAVPRRAAAARIRPALRGAAHRHATRTRCATTCAARATCWPRRAGRSAPDGKLRNASGEAFEFEYLEPNQIGPQHGVPAQPGEARHHAEGALGRLRALSAAPGERSTTTRSPSSKVTSRCPIRPT